MPSDDQLKKQYSKLLDGVILLKQRISRGETPSAVRRRGELMNLKIADISAKDVMLDIDDAEFLTGAQTIRTLDSGIAPK